MSGNDHHDDNHAHGVGHVVPLPILIGVGTALLFLTWLTVFTAKFDLGEANIYVALAIAVFKGSLVALFFMHLRWSRPFNGFVFVGSLVFVALFLAIAMTDTSAYKVDMIEGDAPAVLLKIDEEKAKAGA